MNRREGRKYHNFISKSWCLTPQKNHTGSPLRPKKFLVSKSFMEGGDEGGTEGVS